MLKAVVSDLDGTLLNAHHELSDYTIDVVRKLIDSGYKFYIATGRVEKGAKKISDQIARKIPLITVNGSRIIDENGNEIESVYLNDKCTELLTNLDYKQFGEEIFICAYSGKDWFTTSDEYIKFYSKRRKDKDFYSTIISEEEFKNKKFNKIFFVGKFENLKKLREYLRQYIKEEANIDFVSENSLEVFDISTNKRIGVMKLLEKDGIKPNEVVAFGDGLNDYEMLKFFDNSYIMDNALLELKELLPNKEVIEDNHLDSVAKKIVEVFNL